MQILRVKNNFHTGEHPAGYIAPNKYQIMHIYQTFMVNNREQYINSDA